MFGLAACRVGDWVKSICPKKLSGPFIRGSKTTFVNGRGQIRLRDRSIPGIAITGSSKTFVDGRPAVRVKDKVVCGKILKGSPNTFIG